VKALVSGAVRESEMMNVAAIAGITSSALLAATGPDSIWYLLAQIAIMVLVYLTGKKSPPPNPK
jgi:hypothetical protein